MTNTINTVTIGIPAHNEEGNISRLLADIKRQKIVGFKLSKILVISDGSTDSTVEQVNKVRGLPLTLHIKRKRAGLATSLNYIFNHSKADIVVTLDADIRILDTEFLAKLISPIISNVADYTSSSIQEFPPKSFFPNCLALSMQVKRNIYRAMDRGSNLYTSFGLARAYTQKIYQNMRFPLSVGNDMYSYLYTKSTGQRFLHVPSAVASYVLPTDLSDSSSQSIRYYQARRAMEQYFDIQLVKQSMLIPPLTLVAGILSSVGIICKRPLHFVAYLIYVTFTLFSSLHVKIEDKWVIATTSKHG